MDTLRGDSFEDLSESGIIARNIEIGVDIMEYISFNSSKELQAIGFEDKKSKRISEGLSIAPWVDNTYKKSYVFELYEYIGTPLFYIHTHPGGPKSAREGKPSRLDREFQKDGFDNYILSRHHGLTIYHRNGTYHQPLKEKTHPGLRKKIK